MVTPKITIHVQQDDIPVRGNACVSGDDVYDKEIEDGILKRLDDGDVWAWADVEVRATACGLSASDYLGHCNYENEEGFKTAGDYYPQMVRDACLELSKLVDSLQGVTIEIIES